MIVDAAGHQRTVSYQGCFADESGDRDLDRDVTDEVIGDMTPESCAAACKEKSSRYTYAGVQGREGVRVIVDTLQQCCHFNIRNRY